MRNRQSPDQEPAGSQWRPRIPKASYYGLRLPGHLYTGVMLGGMFWLSAKTF